MKKRLSISLDADVAEFVDAAAAEQRMTITAYINSTLARLMPKPATDQPGEKPRRKRAATK